MRDKRIFLGCWLFFFVFFIWINVNDRTAALVNERRDDDESLVIGERWLWVDVDRAPHLTSDPYSVTIINNNHNVLGMFIDLIILLVKKRYIQRNESSLSLCVIKHKLLASIVESTTLVMVWCCSWNWFFLLLNFWYSFFWSLCCDHLPFGASDDKCMCFFTCW